MQPISSRRHIISRAMRDQSYKNCIRRRGAEQERANRFRSDGIETEAYILRLRTFFEN
jgi:hypothetical protein